MQRPLQGDLMNDYFITIGMVIIMVNNAYTLNV